MDIALSKHQRKLGPALGLGLFLEFAKKLSNDKGLPMSAVVGHAAHGYCDLLGTTKALRSLFVQLDKDEVVVYF